MSEASPMPLDQAKVQQAVLESISQEMDLPPFEIQLTDTVTTLNMDELNVVEVILTVEEVLDIAVPDEGLKVGMTLKQFIEHIHKNGKPRS